MQKLLDQINDAWRPHYAPDEPDGPGVCSAVGIDPRYLPDEYIGDSRVMVTFGLNPFRGMERAGFVPPPILPNEYVFGVHLVGVEGDTVRVYDEWFKALPAAGPGDAGRLVEVMAAISDEEVRLLIKDGREDTRRPASRPVADLDRLTLGASG